MSNAPSMTTEQRARYAAATHRMQSATAWVLKKDLEERDVEFVLKHLRTGLNSAFSTAAALPRLLVEKGLLTWDEYFEAVVVEAERESDARCEEAKERLGLPDSTRFA